MLFFLEPLARYHYFLNYIFSSVFSHLLNEETVIASPFTEPNRSLGTELLMKIVVEVKAQPVQNFWGRRMPINSGQRTSDLKNEADASVITIIINYYYC